VSERASEQCASVCNKDSLGYNVASFFHRFRVLQLSEQRNSCFDELCVIYIF